MTAVHLLDLDDVPDLPTIEIGAGGTGTVATGPGGDRRTFEERYAELGFGLGTVPRKLRRDDAFWETSTGILTVIAGLVACFALLTAGT